MLLRKTLHHLPPPPLTLARTPTNAPSRRGILISILVLLSILRNEVMRQIDRPIKRIGQTAVSTTQHHEANHHFAKRVEVARQRREIRRVTKRKTDVTVRRYDFEEDGEDVESLFISLVYRSQQPRKPASGDVINLHSLPDS